MMQIVYISATPNVITLSRRLPCFFYHGHINQHQNLHFPGLLYIFPSTEHNTFYATLSCSFFFSLSYFIFIFHFRISLSFFNFTFTFTNHIPGFCSARSKCRAAPPRLPAAHQCPSLSIIIIIPPSSVRKFSQFFFGNILFVEAMPRLGNYSVYRGQPKVTMNPKKWPRFWHLPKGSDCEWYWEGRPARNKSGVTFHPTIKPSSKTGDHYHVEVLIGIVTRRIFEYFFLVCSNPPPSSLTALWRSTKRPLRLESHCSRSLSACGVVVSSSTYFLGGRHYGSLPALLESLFRNQHCPRSL